MLPFLVVVVGQTSSSRMLRSVGNSEYTSFRWQFKFRLRDYDCLCPGSVLVRGEEFSVGGTSMSSCNVVVVVVAFSGWQ